MNGKVVRSWQKSCEKPLSKRDEGLEEAGTMGGQRRRIWIGEAPGGHIRNAW